MIVKPVFLTEVKPSLNYYTRLETMTWPSQNIDSNYEQL